MLRARHHFSNGMPSAAGGLTRPTRPATAMIVATYGKINRNWLAAACSRFVGAPGGRRPLDRRSLEGGRDLGEHLEADGDAPLIHHEGWLVNVWADLPWGSYAKTRQCARNLLQHP
jgi:hypothetical protein